MRIERLLVAGCALALGLLLVAPTSAQETPFDCREGEYFPETGHNVCPPFLGFLESRGGPPIFGYPLTEAFVEDGRWVQYFQRVRMEYHPEQVPAYHVQLGLLGDAYAPPEEKVPIGPAERPKSNDRSRRYFRETGHSVALSFLKFFDENGGLDNFGYPVTELLVENGRWTQYFQRAWMELDPNHGIVLRNLGEMWVDQHSQLSQLTDAAPQLAPGAPAPVDDAVGLQASISVGKAVARPTDDQTVWVYVNDQTGRPLEGAAVTLIVPTASGQRTISLPSTDQWGHTQTTFTLDGLEPRQRALLQATVSYQGRTINVQASFTVWW